MLLIGVAMVITINRSTRTVEVVTMVIVTMDVVVTMDIVVTMAEVATILAGRPSNGQAHQGKQS